jgi:hypothetical protein
MNIDMKQVIELNYNEKMNFTAWVLVCTKAKKL